MIEIGWKKMEFRMVLTCNVHVWITGQKIGVYIPEIGSSVTLEQFVSFIDMTMLIVHYKHKAAKQQLKDHKLSY